MSDMAPVGLADIDGVSDAIERVANEPVTPFHTGRSERFDQQTGDSFTHDST
jgi:hypothetical protein